MLTTDKTGKKLKKEKPMAKFYIKNHTIYSKRCRKDIHIAHISDMHLYEQMDEALLYELYKELANANPDVICFTGDLLNEAELIHETMISKKLRVFLRALGKIAPICLVRGNHDSLSFKGEHETYYETARYFENLRNIPNVHVLMGNYPLVKIKDVTFAGFDIGEKTEEYYFDEQESRYAYNMYTKPVLDKLKKELDIDELNILELHSPTHLYEDDHDEYTCLLSGHMHDGALPNIMDKILPGNRGLLAPVGDPFPKFARGVYELSDSTTGIIASPLTVASKYMENPLIRTLYKPGIGYLTIRKK